MHRRVLNVGTIAQAALIGVLALSVGCGGDDDSSPPTNFVPAAQPAAARPSGGDQPVPLVPGGESNDSPAQVSENLFPEVVISTSLGDIRLKFNAEAAPRTVDNFLANYVEQKAFDDTLVHYVEPDFMMALGGFNAQYEPIDTRTPIFNEADNDLKNVKGTVAMARMADYVHSATSQFFINLVDNPSLDYQETEDGEINGYCVFGEVIEGQEVIDKIAASAVHDQNNFPSTPTEPVVVTSIRRVD